MVTKILGIIFESFLSIVLFTIINAQNTHFFRSLRNEKIKYYRAIDYIINDVNDFNFSRVHSSQNAKILCTEALTSLNLMCDKPETESIDQVNEKVDNIYNCIQKIVLCYPHPPDIGNEFLFTENLLINDDKYESWLKDYKYRIEFYRANKIFKKLYTYFDMINHVDLYTVTESKISTLKSVMDKLRIIDESLYEIETLKRDYKPIDSLLEILKSKLAIWSILGTLIFGILLPVYMLLPKQLGLIPENWLILGIFIGLVVCCYATYSKMKQMIDAIIKK